jgi:hypothetical protein
MKKLPSRWKYGLVAVLAILGISSSGATHSQPTTKQTTSIEQQVKGAKSLTVAPTKTRNPTQSIANSVTPSSSPLIRALIPTHADIAPTSVYIPPTQAPAQQPAAVYSGGDKDCTDLAFPVKTRNFVRWGHPRTLDEMSTLINLCF